MAFVTDAETEVVLRDGLSDAAPRGIEFHRSNVRGAIEVLQDTPTPRVLVIDVTGEARPLTALESLSDVVEPDVHVLLIGEYNDVNFYRHATRILGVKEYLFKPITRDMVARHFGPVILNRSRRPESLQGGRVVTVTGVRGGVGASTIAVNLAWHLGKRANRHTVLVDGDLYRGSCALMLNAKSGPGLRTALETPQRIDELFIERTAQPVTDRLHVLSAEENLTDQVNYATGAAARLIETLRRRYNFVVIDAPYSGLELHRDLLMLGHQRILVLEPTLVGVRDALRLLGLPNGPLQVHRGLLVLNRLNRAGMLTRQQTEEALKMKVDVAIPDLPKFVEDAANFGEPAALNNRFNKGIIALAGQATAAFPVESSPEPRTAATRGWRRLWPHTA
ncbi:MAG TPA: AAA family ATPase [Acetobacteraceae bacterium]|jgi:pilus assembly protein CpaE|nr:AAA family ATPase [Acetobacteraceae bacterium]